MRRASIPGEFSPNGVAILEFGSGRVSSVTRASLASKIRYYSDRLLELGNGRHLLQQEFARSALDHRKIGKPHINAGLKQPRQERHGASRPVNLSDDERDLTHARGGQCPVQRRAIRALSALDFSKLGNDAPIAAVEVRGNSLALRLDTKPALGLLPGRNTVVGNESAM
jgi:hypothetical protein